MSDQLGCERQNNFISSIADADDTQAITKILFRMTIAFGFTAATFMVMPARTDKMIADLILETMLHRRFFELFDEIGGAENSLLFEMLRKTILPISWSLDEFRGRYHNLGRALPPLFDLFAGHGLTMGLAIPLTTIDGSRHIIRYDGNRKPLSRDEVNELTMLSMHAFEAYDRVRSSQNGYNSMLTAREMEVVRWTAAGKTSAEIGVIMDLSDHTINAYMNNAFKKFNCVNRSQLVAKALRMRMIS